MDIERCFSVLQARIRIFWHESVFCDLTDNVCVSEVSDVLHIMLGRMGQNKMLSSEVFRNEDSDLLVSQFYDDYAATGQHVGGLCTSSLVALDEDEDHDGSADPADVHSFGISFTNKLETELRMTS